jgi:hypothetical protein
VVFPLKSGEREVLITNMKEEEESAFEELYYKRWPIERKYKQVKQKLELENFSGRLVGVLKDRLIGILITDDPFVGKYLYEELDTVRKG